MRLGESCSTNAGGGGGRGTRIVYGGESQSEGDHWEDQDVGGWIILRWILER
jgi:hypothetical protein